MLFLNWLIWIALVDLDFPRPLHDEVTPFVTEMSFNNIIAKLYVCAKGSCFCLAHQSFLFISLWFHRMPRRALVFGNFWECFLTFRFQLPGLCGELLDIMYLDFLKACDKVCHKTLLQRLSGHIWWQDKYHHRSKMDKETKRQRVKWSVFIRVKGWQLRFSKLPIRSHAKCIY